MSDTLNVLQVFIASPSDLVDERKAIKEVVDDLNVAFVKEVGLQIQLLVWEDRPPGYRRAQEQINEDVDKADLFVGFLWRRWGSDPGNSRFTSGFEEEFNRAVERREKSGSPEISLFFKDPNILPSAGPNDQLERVLRFRRETEASKKLLFAEFSDIEDWKKQTRDLLQRHLLRLHKSTMASRNKEKAQAPPPSSAGASEKSAAGQEGKSSTSAAKQQVIRVWVDALEAIKQGELSEFSKSKSLDRLKVARLGLAAAGITNRDIEAEMPGVHLTNLLYKNRKQVELTQVEWLLVLRANLLPHLGYEPGWFWLKKTTLKVNRVLIYLACYDEHAGVRAAAIGYASDLNLLFRRLPRGGQRPIDILCSHSDAATRKLGVKHLADKGSTKDLTLIEALRTDSDSEVRSQADTARDAILLRDDASRFFERSVLPSPWMSEDGLSAIRARVAEIRTELLRRALAHADAKVQAFAAIELATRSSISTEEIKALKDEDVAYEVLQKYFLKAIATGTKFSTREIREALEPPILRNILFDHSRLDPSFVIAEMFKLYTYEDLIAVVDSNSASEDSLIAYRVLAEKHFDKFGERIRIDLKTDFAAMRAKLRTPKGDDIGMSTKSLLSSLLEKWSPDIASLVDVGLQALAIHGNDSDRDLVIPYLKDRAGNVRIGAVKALRRVGMLEDAELVLRIAEEAEEEVAIEATKTALTIAPGLNGSANRLLKSEKVALVKLAILSLMDCDPKKVWSQIGKRLYDENDKVRQLICAYAIKQFSPRRLAKLLDEYLSEDRYFYNVVYFLDRSLYAKHPLRKRFVEELEASLV